jgi:hypothetical protein
MGPNWGNAGSDDLLALQASEQQLEHNLSGNDEVVLSLNCNPEILVSESKTFTNCLLVRRETPTSRFQERCREMAEIEHFLDLNWRFSGVVQGIRGTDPGPDRDQMLERFWRGIHVSRYEEDMTRERLWQVCRYIALYDEELSDVSGLSEEKERCRRASCSSHVVAGGGVALSSLVPYSLKCERAFGPSHVDEGGGNALQGIPFSGMDRSSPIQSERFRAEGGPSQC